MGKLIGAVLGSILVLLIVGAGPLVWFYDRGAVDRWGITLPIPFWHPHLGLPRSLAGQLADARAATKAYADAEKAAQVRARAIEAAQAAITAQAATHDAAAQAAIVVRYRTLIQKVPTYVTPQIDARYPLPWSFVRLLDGGAAGLDVPSAADGPGQADDAPSDVTASQASTVILGDFRSADANAQTLLDLQAWVRDQGMAPK
jgi:hypothetical protein